MKGMFFLGKYLILVILVLGQLHGYKGCVEKERKALLEFVKYIISITIEEYSDYALPTWTYNTKSDCCRWEGVKCNRTSKRVTEIAFGTLSLKENSLLNLSLLHPFEDIRSLNLSRNNYYYNQFSGLFDDVEGYKTLRKLRKLEIMDLSRNRFNNSIFRFLNSAISLKTLFLGDNNFYGGSLPAKELKDLTNLELLDLSGNRFNGSIPIQELSALSKLKSLDLSRNKFSELSKLQGKVICPEETGSSDLSDNEFSGSIELQGNTKYILSYSVKNGGICEMKKMQDLDLSGNKIVGQFPLCLTRLTGLQVLDLSSNQLNGNVPSALGSFPLDSLANLSELSRIWKFLEAKISTESYFPTILQLGKVYMKLANNGFQGNLPSSLGNIKSIEFLDLSHNNFHGELPRSFVMNGYFLKYLKLSHNKLSGQVFPEFVNFTLLWELSMDNNMFTGKIGEGLRNSKYLQLLKISNNNLTGVIPSWIGKFPSLMALQVSNNSLEGEIPISLFYLPYLLLMDLSANILSGDIPPCVKSNDLTVLLLQDNHLSGEIPYTLLENLYVFYLINNRLPGNIPEFTNIQNNHTLLVRGNNLTGNISSQLCGLRNIQLLDLANNRLNGSIPSCLKNTSFVFGKKYILYDDDYSNLFIGENELSGNIPTELEVFWNYKHSMLLTIKPDNGVNDDESQIDMGSFYWSFLAAYVTILLGIFSSLPFDSPWSRFWFYVVDVFIHKSCGHSRRSHFPVTGLQSWMMVLGDVPALSDSASQLACPK
ncbi:unnamed protein product [Brassica oleracea var. botrytis]